MRILAIDDSKATREFMKSAIDVLGFEFLEAANGKEGLEVLEKEKGRVDLILLDWYMPIMDGMEILQLLKSTDQFKDIPITMVTTETNLSKVKQAVEKGATNYLMKPFSQEELVGKIIEALGMKT
jgi:two-component system chemotaxis response regulator CheY